MILNEQSLQQRQKNLHSKKKKFLASGIVWSGYLLMAFIFLFISLACGIVYGSVQGMIASAPSADGLAPKTSMTIIYDREKKEVQRLYDYASNREIIPFEQMPDNLKNAFIAIEDERFYEHNGVDVKAILRATYSLATDGNMSQGASTITQQLIKNNKFGVGGESTMAAKVKRKIQEQWLAIQVEKNSSKEAILKDYLNSINLGKGTLGVEAASKYYFNKHAKDLTLSECAILAAITKNPVKLNPVDQPGNNQQRQQIVLAKMLELNFISNEEYQAALKDDLYAKISKNASEAKASKKVNSYFTDALILQLVSDLQEQLHYSQEEAYNLVYRGGLKIYATQDSGLQRVATRIINNADNYPKGTKYSLEYSLEIQHPDGSSDSYSTEDVLAFYRKKNKKYKTIYSSKDKMKKAARKFAKSVIKEGDLTEEEINYSLEPQLSYTLIDQTTGYVRVLIGGRGTKFDDLSLNRATTCPRQPGSTFKILSTYAPALDSGAVTLASVFYDAPYQYEGGREVHNFNKDSYNGMTTVRDAIIKSNNIVAVKTLTKITPQVGYNYLTALGFTTLVNDRVATDGSLESDVNQALALGGLTDGVTNLELNAAYAAIANKGQYNKPILYTAVKDSNGNLLLQNKPKAQRVMKETTAWLLTNAMEDVVSDGTGTDAQLDSDMAVAGKTGTSSDNKDYWFAGYTPYYTATVWTGHDYAESFDNSSNYHKKIWAKIMNAIIDKRSLKSKSFGECKAIITESICRKSGQLSKDGVCSNDPAGSMRRTEYFVKGSAPEEICQSHISLRICSKSGKCVGQYCPDGYKTTRVYRIRPENSSNKTADANYYMPSGLQNSTCSYHTLAWKKKEEEKKRKEALRKKRLEEEKKRKREEAKRKKELYKQTLPEEYKPEQ